MIVLQIYFLINDDKTKDFESLYDHHYVSALRKQKGYLGSKLLRIYPHEKGALFNAMQTDFNYQMELYFDTEENRLTWASTEIHAEVWGMAERLFEKAGARGYDIVTDDDLT